MEIYRKQTIDRLRFSSCFTLYHFAFPFLCILGGNDCCRLPVLCLLIGELRLRIYLCTVVHCPSVYYSMTEVSYYTLYLFI